MTPVALEEELPARLVTAPTRFRDLTVRLTYDPHDPLAVRARFPGGADGPAAADGARAVWYFGRDLLDAGLDAPSGDGDVHVWRCGRHAIVELRRSGRLAVLRLDAAELRAFLDLSFAAVPAGTEGSLLATDTTLVRLLDGA